jgi:hypothetical protein
MRTVLFVLMLVPPAINLVMLLALHAHWLRFKQTVPALRTAEDLQRLQQLASLHMYAALVTLVLILIPLPTWIYGHVVAETLTMEELSFAIVPGIILGGLAALAKSPAKQAREMPASDAALQAQRDHIADVWLHRALPDW